MPFDGVPEGVVSDLVKLRIALDGVRTHWREGAIGRQTDATHCAIGWLLVATEWNRDEAVRLALDYVYPALPEKARDPSEGRLEAIASYNDNGSASRIEKLFTNACQLAERQVVH